MWSVADARSADGASDTARHDDGRHADLLRTRARGEALVTTSVLPAYLTALGLLRAVGSQCDPAARLAWSEDCKRWEITGDALPSLDAVAAWLARAWTPTPLVSPWNGRGGWWGSGCDTVEAVRASTDPRLASYRATVAAVDSLLARCDVAAKPEGAAKAALVRALRNELPDAALPWIDAVWRDDGERLRPAPLLGSGGNEGSYDYACHYARRALVVIAQPEEATRAQLAALVSAKPTRRTEAESAGALWPAGAPINPLAYLLALEGACLFAAGWSAPVGAHPWQCALSPHGYATSVAGDEGRGEVWLPYWSGDASLPEVSALVAGGWYAEATDGLGAALGVALGRVPAGVAQVRRMVSVVRHGRAEKWLDGGLYAARGALAERVGAVTKATHEAILADAMATAGGNRSRAAAALGVPQERVTEWMHRYPWIAEQWPARRGRPPTHKA